LIVMIEFLLLRMWKGWNLSIWNEKKPGVRLSGNRPLRLMGV